MRRGDVAELVAVLCIVIQKSTLLPACPDEAAPTSGPGDISRMSREPKRIEFWIKVGSMLTPPLCRCPQPRVRKKGTVVKISALRGYGCRQGLCGTRSTRVVTGTVQMDVECGLTSQEKSTGYVLPCVCRARGRLSWRLNLVPRRP
jgi:hypothetical protein